MRPRGPLVALAFVALGTCACRRRAAPIHADPPTVDAAVDSDARADAPATNEGRKRLDLAAGDTCVATDALYARDGSRVARFTGSSEAAFATPGPSFATAKEWTARGGAYAWTLPGDASTEVTLNVGLGSARPRSISVSSSRSPDRVQPVLCGGWIGYVESKATDSSDGLHVIIRDALVLERLGGGDRRVFPTSLTFTDYESVASTTCAETKVIARFDRWHETPLFAIELASGARRSVFSGTGAVLGYAAWKDVLFVATEKAGSHYLSADVVERLGLLSGTTPAVVLTPRPSEFERVRLLFTSGDVLLVPMTEAGADSDTSDRHSLLEIDAASGALRRRVATERPVKAAYKGDALVWCDDRAVYSLP